MNLSVNTVTFAIAFAAWVALGPAARVIGEELHLTASELAWLKALPILAGAGLRVPMGVLADRHGARVVFPALLLVGAVATLALSTSQALPGLLLGSFAMGSVGATFVVGVRSVVTWTPPERRGVALGVFGSANVGTAITTFALPFLLQAVGWRDALRLYAAVLAVTAVAYRALVRHRPSSSPTTLGTLTAPLRAAAAWRYGLYYMATFGIFVAVTLLATDLYVDVHGLSLPTAGVMATTFTLSSSLARIPGGWLADRLGGDPVLGGSLLVVVLALAPLALGPGLGATVGLVFVAGLAMGVGMAATFRCIPDRFPTSVGAAGGVVGALGGLAGFFLPLVGEAARSVAGVPEAQWVPIGGLAALALVLHRVADGQGGATSSIWRS